MKQPEITIPEYLIDATPGAREARDRWLAEQELSGKLHAALVAAQRAYPPTQWIGSPGNAQRVPKGDTTQAQLDAAYLAEREAARAVEAQRKRTRRALETFHALFEPDSPASYERRRRAAELALAKQAEAEAAWETLRAALAERNDAARRAGAPIELMGRTSVDVSGKAGEVVHRPGALTDASLPTLSEFQVAERTVSASVDRFRADVLEAIAKEGN
jgi:hypothetical protein